MNERRPQDWLRERLRLGRATDAAPTPPVRRRRMSRREREARRRRQLYWGMFVAGTLIVLILAIGSAREYFFIPREVLASVEGTEIRRRDYWKVRSYDLITQASQYQQFAMFAQGNQQAQYQTMAQQALTELDTVEGSTDVNETTLSRMIEDQIYLKSMDELGLELTDEDVDQYILQQFEPTNAPLFTPTPEPTLIPTRAAWATATARAQISPTPGVGTPGASPVAGTPAATPVASPVAGASPVATPAASPVASLDATPAESPTPSREEAVQTAEAGFGDYKDTVLGEADMSRADYERLIARPAVARQKVRSVLESDVGQRAEQMHAAHILVGTQDLANSIYQQVTAEGADFEQIAQEQSTDTATAPNGGDLGSFTHGAMVDEFENAAFSLQPGEISEPFNTQFGWHIVKVYAHVQDRPLTDEQIGQVKERTVQQWVDEQRAELDITSDLEPTPTPATEQFVPPPDAPPPPTPTAIGSPAASPEVAAASPIATPGDRPMASPRASPIP